MHNLSVGGGNKYLAGSYHGEVTANVTNITANTGNEKQYLNNNKLIIIIII